MADEVTKSERTSKRVAAIAGRLLKALVGASRRDKICVWIDREGLDMHHDGLCTAAELRAVCASALTQAKDKPKRKNVSTRARSAGITRRR